MRILKIAIFILTLVITLPLIIVEGLLFAAGERLQKLSDKIHILLQKFEYWCFDYEKQGLVITKHGMFTTKENEND